MDYDNLPQDVMLLVLMLMDLKSIVRLKGVSRTLHALISHNQLFWRKKFDQDFGKWEGGDADFEEEYKIECGWRVQNPKVTELRLPHECLTLSCCREFNGGSRWLWETINDMKVRGSILVSGSWEGTVRVVDLTKRECLHTLKARTVVSSVAISDDTVFAGMMNGEICAWSLASGEQRRKWQAHRDGDVHALSVSDDRLISGANRFVRVWDASTFEKLHQHKLQGEKRMWVSGKDIVCGLHWGGQIHVLHQEDGLLYNLDGCQEVDSLCANSRHIFVKGRGLGIQVWDRETEKRVAFLNGGPIENHVWCDERKLITTQAGCVKIWDAHRLVCVNNFHLDRIYSELMDCTGEIIFFLYSDCVRCVDLLVESDV